MVGNVDRNYLIKTDGLKFDDMQLFKETACPY